MLGGGKVATSPQEIFISRHAWLQLTSIVRTVFRFYRDNACELNDWKRQKKHNRKNVNFMRENFYRIPACKSTQSTPNAIWAISDFNSRNIKAPPPPFFHSFSEVYNH